MEFGWGNIYDTRNSWVCQPAFASFHQCRCSGGPVLRDAADEVVLVLAGWFARPAAGEGQLRDREHEDAAEQPSPQLAALRRNERGLRQRRVCGVDPLEAEGL